ncbi:MAG: sigma 54-interacting transcriptional regulator, partial [Myxococcota bacterium]|nr:sigma 54-interacting transcriptional regulator [Myxococcota bacterium]
AAREVYAALDEPERQAEVSCLEAERLLREGRHAEARDLVRGRTPVLSRFPRHHAAALLVAADALEARGSDPCASIDRATEIARRLRDDEILWRVHVRQARHLLGIHRIDEARRALDAARAADRRIREHAPPEFLGRMERMPERTALAAIERRLADADAAGACAPAAAPMPSSPFVAESPTMRVLLERARRIAGSDAPVLLTGESGTGKDRIAREIHDAGRRAGAPFVKVSCGAIVEDLLLSELLGHERGAFTGAVERRAGWFEAASGGTLFLDEIADASARVQAVILRIVEEGRLVRVGGTAPVRIDVRVICATNRPVEDLVRSGSFRADLFYKLRPMRLHVPPLRERPEDVAPIARAMLAAAAADRPDGPRAFGTGAIEFLSGLSWPGNVRELENVVRAAAVLCEGNEIGIDQIISAGARPASPSGLPGPLAADLHREIEIGVSDVLAGRRALPKLLDRIARAVVARVTAEEGGDAAAAARRLGTNLPLVLRTLRGAGIKRLESPGIAGPGSASRVRGSGPGTRAKGVRS